jgi:hypothetical protein
MLNILKWMAIWLLVAAVVIGTFLAVHYLFTSGILVIRINLPQSASTSTTHTGVCADGVIRPEETGPCTITPNQRYNAHFYTDRVESTELIYFRITPTGETQIWNGSKWISGHGRMPTLISRGIPRQLTECNASCTFVVRESPRP